MTLEELMQQQTEWLRKLAATTSGKPETAPAEVLRDQLEAAKTRLAATTSGREAMLRRADVAVERGREDVERLERAVREAEAEPPREEPDEPRRNPTTGEVEPGRATEVIKARRTRAKDATETPTPTPTGKP